MTYLKRVATYRIMPNVGPKRGLSLCMEIVYGMGVFEI